MNVLFFSNIKLVSAQIQSISIHFYEFKVHIKKILIHSRFWVVDCIQSEICLTSIDNKYQIARGIQQKKKV